MTEERLKAKLAEAKRLNRELAKSVNQKQKMIDKLLAEKSEASDKLKYNQSLALDRQKEITRQLRNKVSYLQRQLKEKQERLDQLTEFLANSTNKYIRNKMNETL